MRYTLSINDNLDLALINDVEVIAKITLFDDDVATFFIVFSSDLLPKFLHLITLDEKVHF